MTKAMLSIFIITMLFQEVIAQNILHCLAKEEEKIHRQKSEGPLYRLNQYFVSQLAGLTGVKLKDRYFEMICHKNRSESLKLLESLLINKSDIFNFKTLSRDSGTQIYQKAEIQTLIDSAPNLFFTYLSGLQAKAKDPKCLEKEIIELKYFMERYMFLEGEIKTETLLDDKIKIQSVFKKLENISAIYKRCLPKNSNTNKASKP